MTPEQETKCEIAKRFALFAERYADERARYTKRLTETRETGANEEARHEVNLSGCYAANAAEGVLRQFQALRKEFRLAPAEAARTMQTVCDWLFKQHLKDDFGNDKLDPDGNPITVIGWSPNVAGVVNAALEFWRSWRGKMVSASILRGNEPADKAA